jgi:hypothetical protein
MTGRLAAAGLVIGGLLAAGVARANPRPLPFTYQSESLPQGTGEVEQFVDFVPTKAQTPNDSAAVWFLASQLQTEVEYGLTDKLELAIYFTFVPSTERFVNTPVMPEGNGMKQRLRYRFADPEAWPIDVAVYGEIAENEREIELEAKLILQRRIDRLRLITNLWAERELYFDGEHEWVLHPTVGATYELNPKFHLGAEGWMHAEYGDEEGPRPFAAGPHVYVGPAAMINFGKLWWTTGVYWRVTDTGRSVQVGDAFGPLWIRTVIGIGY